MQSLPVDILFDILIHLDTTTVFRFTGTCKKFRELITNRFLWEKLFYHESRLELFPDVILNSINITRLIRISQVRFWIKRIIEESLLVFHDIECNIDPLIASRYLGFDVMCFFSKTFFRDELLQSFSIRLVDWYDIVMNGFGFVKVEILCKKNNRKECIKIPLQELFHDSKCNTLFQHILYIYLCCKYETEVEMEYIQMMIREIKWTPTLSIFLGSGESFSFLRVCDTKRMLQLAKLICYDWDGQHVTLSGPSKKEQCCIFSTIIYFMFRVYLAGYKSGKMGELYLFLLQKDIRVPMCNACHSVCRNITNHS